MRQLRIKLELWAQRVIEFDHRNEANVEHTVNEGPEMLTHLLLEQAPHIIGSIFN